MSYREGHQFSLKDIDLTQNTGVDFSKYSSDELKKLWRKTVKNGMHGLCFSLYEDGILSSSMFACLLSMRRPSSPR